MSTGSTIEFLRFSEFPGPVEGGLDPGSTGRRTGGSVDDDAESTDCGTASISPLSVLLGAGLVGCGGTSIGEEDVQTKGGSASGVGTKPKGGFKVGATGGAFEVGTKGGPDDGAGPTGCGPDGFRSGRKT